MSIHDFTKITVLFFKIFPYFSQTQLCPQLLPEAVRCCRCFWHGGMHQNGVRADGLDLPPRDGQTLVPTQQTKKSWPAQQDQALQLRRYGVKLQIIGPETYIQRRNITAVEHPEQAGTPAYTDYKRESREITFSEYQMLASITEIDTSKAIDDYTMQLIEQGVL